MSNQQEAPAPEPYKRPNPADLSSSISGYTLPSVLHFLQVEWRTFEQQRNEWEIERAELKSKICILEGGREGLEAMKSDLQRRVKMLEYTLKQQRLGDLTQT
jgi:Striatin family